MLLGRVSAQKEPEKFDTFYAEAIVLMDNQDYNKAIDKLTQAININNNYYYYYLKRADVFYAQKRYNNAKSDYIIAENIMPGAALLQIAKCYAHLNIQKEAIAYLKKYLKQKDKVPFAQIKLDSAFITLSQTKEWNELLKQKHYKKNDIKLDRAAYLISMEKNTDAVNILNELLSKYKTNSRAYSLRGDIFFAKKQFKKALKDYTKAIENDRKNILYYKKRALTYTELKKHKNAAADYNQILTYTPNNTNFYFHKAYAEYKAENFHTAIDNINFYIKYYNNNTDSQYLKALILQKQDDNFGALRTLNKCIEENKSEYKYYQARAESYSAAGMTEKAENDISMALDLHPSGELYFIRAKIRQQRGNMNMACEDIKMAEHYGYYKASDLRNSFCK